MIKLDTVLVQCGHETEGPQVGRWVVAWRRRCRRMVRVTAGAVYVKCWQHGGERK